MKFTNNQSLISLYLIFSLVNLKQKNTDEIYCGSKNKNIANTKKNEDIIEEELYDCDDRMV